MDKEMKDKENVLIFDLGGGTFDVSILTLDDGVYEVKSTNGDMHLGGEDFDKRLMDYCIKEIKNTTQEDMTKNARALKRLKTEC